MTDRVCLADGCEIPLVGRQIKFCTDLGCKRERARWARILSAYGLSKQQYEAIVEHQQGRCPITGRVLGDTTQPHIDHDHATGVVRGVVTAYANTRLIGRLRDWKTAQNLADYLRTPPAVAALGAPVIAPSRPPKRRKGRKKR